MKAAVIAIINPLTPESDEHLISPTSITPESHINLKTPKSDKHLTSAYNITSYSHIQLTGIKEMIIK